MASLYNNKISATYVGLIKTLDSAVINATLRELSDGLGNQTGLFINTSGDFKATGILEFGSLKDTGENITITKFVDEADGIANNDNDTTIPTSAAIIDYVASQVTLEDLDFSGDSGSGSVDLDSQTFAIVGTANEIETSASGQQLQVGIVTNPTLTGDVTITGDLNISQGEIINIGTDFDLYETATGAYIQYGTNPVIFNGNADVIFRKQGSEEKTAVFTPQGSAKLYYDNSLKLETTTNGLTVTGKISSLTDPTDAQDAATKAYVDSQVTAQDLDFGGDSGTGSVDLDSQSLSVTGTTNQVVTSATNQTLNISLPATVHRNLQGDVTGDLTGNVTATSVLADGVTATTQSQGDNSTKVATTAYVDAGLSDQDTLAEVLAVGNTTGGTDIAISSGDDIIFADNSSAYFGNANDLQIYHDTTSNNSFIKETGVGSLQIWCKDFEVYNAGGTETLINADVNAGVQLYYDNLVKFATVSNGVDITGDLDVSGEVSVGADDSIFDNNTLRFKSSGNAFIDHNTVGQSLYIRTSNASSLDTNAVIIASDGDIDLSGSLTIAQDLTVNGTTTTVNTETLAVEDPLISMAKDNAANSVDIGFYGRYNDGSNRYLGLYADASDTNTFKLFKGTTTEPTTTVDSTATGYALADLDVATLTATSSIAVPSITLDEYITHTGNTDSYFGFPSNDNFSVTTGTNTNLSISSSGLALRHSGSTKLETVAGGITVTGDGDFSSTVYVGSDDSLFANNNLRFKSPGAAYIDHNTVGQSFTFRVSNASALDTTPLVIDSGGQSVFYGDVTLDSDSTKLKLGDNQDLQLYHDGANSYIETTTTSAGDLYIKALGSGHDLYLRAADDINIQPQGGNNGIKVIGQGAVELYHNNSKKFETTSTGVEIKNGTAGYSVISGDGNGAVYSANGDLQFYTNNSAYAINFYSANKGSKLIAIADSGTTKITATKAYGSETATLRVATSPTGTNYSDGAYANIVFGDETIANSHLGEIQVIQSNASASTASEMRFRTNSGGGNSNCDDRLIITSYGNIGATTEVENSNGSWRNFQFGSATIVGRPGTLNPDAMFGTNFKFTTANAEQRISAHGTSRLFFNDDTITFQSAGADSAGSNIGWNTRMTIGSGGAVDIYERLKVSGGNTDQYYFEGARNNVGVTYRLYDNANNIYHDSYASQVIRVNQLGGTGGGFFFSGGDFNLTTTNVHINGGTSYNDKSNIYLSNGRTLIQSDIVDGTAQGDTSLDFQTRSSGSLSSAMFIDEFRRIGINNSDPSTRLHIKQPSNDRAGGFYSQINGGTYGLSMFVDSGGYGIIGGGGTFSNDVLKMDFSNAYLGIGGAPTHKFYVRNDVAATSDLDPTAIKLYNNSDGGSAIEFSNGVSAKSKLSFGVEGTGGSTDETYIGFSTGINGALNEQARIDSNGNLVLRNGGLSAPTSGYLNEFFIANNGSEATFSINGSSNGDYGTMKFQTRKGDSSDPLTAMFIDEDAQVRIGKTSGLNNAAGINLKKTSDGGVILITRGTGSATMTNILFFNDTGGQAGNITTTNTSVSYNTSSDYRLKEDLQDFNALDKILQIPVYDFKWKSEDKRSYGVIAHELQAVLPDAISGEKDAEDMQSVDYSKIVPLLVKSIQELKAEIEELKRK